MKRISVLVTSAPAAASAQRAFQLIRDLADQGHQITLCLLEDGVYAATGQVPGVPLDRCSAVLALEPDTGLRGIGTSGLHTPCRLCGYSDVVDLVMTGSDQTLGAF